MQNQPRKIQNDSTLNIHFRDFNNQLIITDQKADKNAEIRHYNAKNLASPQLRYCEITKKKESVQNNRKHRKKWLLIQPISNTSMMVDSGTVSMPLNLIMVATLVGKLFDVTFIDERLGDKVPEDFSGYDVIAITSRTLNASQAYRIGDAALKQGKTVILGGVHPTMLHDEASQHCTSVVYGEIESIWTELASDVLKGTMQPLPGKGAQADERHAPPRFQLCPFIEKLQKNTAPASPSLQQKDAR